MSLPLLVVYTGGTFGMQPSQDGLVTASNLAASIDQAFDTTERQQLPSFDIIELATLIDSSNLRPSMWTAIIETINQNSTKYGGFVIIHGTDTLAYTASLLSFVFKDLAKTIVVTGSQIPLLNAHTDAKTNFSHALNTAQDAFNEVVICFDQKILRANRSTKISASDWFAFDTPNVAPLTQPTAAAVPSEPCNGNSDWQFEDDTVAVVKLYPGMSPSMLSALQSDNCKAVIIQSFGMGNLPSNNQPLMQALQKLAAADKLLVNITSCAHGNVNPGYYAAGTALSQEELLNGHDLSLEAAFAKLHYLFALPLDLRDIKRLMQTNLAREMTC